MAPVMEAPAASLSGGAETMPAGAVTAKQEKYSGYQHLFGAVDASLLGGTYRVYLVTEKDGAWAAYEAFPVYEEEKLGAAGSCDSGWSAYVKEETIAGAKLYLAVESEGRLMMGAMPEER